MGTRVTNRYSSKKTLYKSPWGRDLSLDLHVLRDIRSDKNTPSVFVGDQLINRQAYTL